MIFRLVNFKTTHKLFILNLIVNNLGFKQFLFFCLFQHKFNLILPYKFIIPDFKQKPFNHL